MKLHEILEEIRRVCRTCKECDPCCTGYILKKYIEDNKPELRAA